mmetsp:Transcript_49246/g.107125  ORF Transcript_49246/g.107125 Transcript_49246/m.107125 type:complete len:98 (+) Transcript_49246:41-334(+)
MPSYGWNGPCIPSPDSNRAGNASDEFHILLNDAQHKLQSHTCAVAQRMLAISAQPQKVQMVLQRARSTRSQIHGSLTEVPMKENLSNHAATSATPVE